MKQDQRGEKLLRKSIKFAPKHGKPYHALGLLLVRQKRYTDAETMLAKAATLEPNNYRYAYVYALTLNFLGKTSLAEIELKKLLKRQPTNVEVLRELLNMHHRKKDWKGAIYYGEILLSIQPDDTSLKQLVNYFKRENR